MADEISTSDSAKTLATIQTLRETLVSEATPLPLRFRALFSLKHLSRHADAAGSLAAIEAIAAGFGSSSELLKHELAYCLGQSGNLAAALPLREVLADLSQAAMARHEAAEALGALGDQGSLDMLREYRDREGEDAVITETCEIAIDRIMWENSAERKQEKVRQR